ncbi:hypothetical protein [Jiella avicenniae]|uniref:Uncharacterized protein n=1 Tax=Jiella avicenniae TaxID=2907202 RepID=A0A9X1P551_9HYPH|nr:hypothetical protein [Jiella avicenniae]MCE7029478.1 hypothetical protein [Jiella avicenniae]
MPAHLSSPDLPGYLEDCLQRHCGAQHAGEVKRLMRPAAELMRVDSLKCFKASRLSFADVLIRKMTREEWRIELVSSVCEDDAAAKFVYHISAGGHEFTYIARAYPWDGIEKVGRRSDGANRDLFGALFVGVADQERIAREFATFDTKSEGLAMRTDADVMGWTPANRSSRHFDTLVDWLARGEQPPAEQANGYLMRNGGFQSSGRNGSVSFLGIPEDHPLAHPFFADLFAVYLVRLVSIDLANAVARQRNPAAAQLDPAIARQLGIGNSSGQGMCVALQRWPHWVATWVVVRETAIAFAKHQKVTDAGRAKMHETIAHTIGIYRRTDPQSEDYVASNEVIIADLKRVDAAIDDPALERWNDLADALAERIDPESREQLNSMLLDLVPEFCDAVAPYLKIGAARRRSLKPEMTVRSLRDILRRNYGWALRSDRTLAASHQHFWYHSADNGEQRRGERIVDQHEHFESFIDHIGLIHRLAAVLASHDDDVLAGDVVLAHPELHFAISRVQYLDGLAYAEIWGGLADRDFRPADLIRFFLASLGIRGSTPLSIRYVRGTFFQDQPLPADFSPDRSKAASSQADMERILS